MARQTSITSFYDISQSRKRLLYDAIIQMLRSNPNGLTDSEIVNITPQFLQSLEPRVRRNELYNRGVIISEGTRKCTVTGKNVTIWKLKENVR